MRAEELLSREGSLLASRRRRLTVGSSVPAACSGTVDLAPNPLAEQCPVSTAVGRHDHVASMRRDNRESACRPTCAALRRRGGPFRGRSSSTIGRHCRIPRLRRRARRNRARPRGASHAGLSTHDSAVALVPSSGSKKRGAKSPCAAVANPATATRNIRATAASVAFSAYPPSSFAGFPGMDEQRSPAH
jgi:hypothetical protein